LDTFFFNSHTYISRSAVGFPSHFLISSPWSHRKIYKLPRDVFCFSQADPKKGFFLLTAPAWAPVHRKSSLSSSFCNMFSFLSAALVIFSTAEMQACIREDTLSSNRHNLMTTSPTVAPLSSCIKLIIANKWTYVNGALCTTFCNKGWVYGTLSGFTIFWGSL